MTGEPDLDPKALDAACKVRIERRRPGLWDAVQGDSEILAFAREWEAEEITAYLSALPRAVVVERYVEAIRHLCGPAQGTWQAALREGRRLVAEYDAALGESGDVDDL